MHNITATLNGFCKTVNRMMAFYRRKSLGFTESYLRVRPILLRF